MSSQHRPARENTTSLLPASRRKLISFQHLQELPLSPSSQRPWASTGPPSSCRQSAGVSPPTQPPGLMGLLCPSPECHPLHTQQSANPSPSLTCSKSLKTPWKATILSQIFFVLISGFWLGEGGGCTEKLGSGDLTVPGKMEPPCSSRSIPVTLGCP